MESLGGMDRIGSLERLGSLGRIGRVGNLGSPGLAPRHYLEFWTRAPITESAF